MQNRLKILHESSTYIDEVFVCIPGMNRKISSVDGVELVGEKNQEFQNMQEKSLLSPIFMIRVPCTWGQPIPII